MRSIRRERGVLKLVHPGKYVEVHREPIRAAEVMRRNPRHCITRPDVFEFPWIVVKPESVLLPGSLFLIVPNRTIYDLLKAKGQGNQSPFSQENESPNNHAGQQLKQHSPVSSYAGMSSKLQGHKQYIKGLFVRREKEGREGEGKLHIFNKIFLSIPSLSPFFQRSLSSCLIKKMSPDVENLCKYDWDKRFQNHSQVELWPKVNSYEDTRKKIEEELLEESNFEYRPYEAKQYYQKNRKDIGTEMPKEVVNQEFVSNERVTTLKSCLRRTDSVRKSLNLKVSFNIPVKKVEQLRGIH